MYNIAIHSVRYGKLLSCPGIYLLWLDNQQLHLSLVAKLYALVQELAAVPPSLLVSLTGLC